MPRVKNIPMRAANAIKCSFYGSLIPSCKKQDELDKILSNNEPNNQECWDFSNYNMEDKVDEATKCVIEAILQHGYPCKVNNILERCNKELRNLNIKVSNLNTFIVNILENKRSLFKKDKNKKDVWYLDEKALEYNENKDGRRELRKRKNSLPESYQNIDRKRSNNTCVDIENLIKRINESKLTNLQILISICILKSPEKEMKVDEILEFVKNNQKYFTSKDGTPRSIDAKRAILASLSKNASTKPLFIKGQKESTWKIGPKNVFYDIDTIPDNLMEEIIAFRSQENDMELTELQKMIIKAIARGNGKPLQLKDIVEYVEPMYNQLKRKDGSSYASNTKRAIQASLNNNSNNRRIFEMVENSDDNNVYWSLSQRDLQQKERELEIERLKLQKELIKLESAQIEIESQMLSIQEEKEKIQLEWKKIKAEWEKIDEEKKLLQQKVSEIKESLIYSKSDDDDFDKKENKKLKKLTDKKKKKETNKTKKKEKKDKKKNKSDFTNRPSNLYQKASSSDFRSKIPVKDISNQNLKALPDEILSNSHITKLYMKCNCIKSLKGIENLTELIVLEASNNNFKEIPENIMLLSKIKDLNFSENMLTSVPQSIKSLINITKLDLGGNNFQEFPKAICNLVNLQWLNLSHNKITEIPKEIASFTSLTHLYIHHNNITKVTGSICQLSRLKELDLNNNLLETITHSIGELDHLVVLDLSFNKLNVLPDGLKHGGNLESLQKLNLSNNQIAIIENVYFDVEKDIFPSLEELSIGNNLIEEIPLSFWKKLCNLTNLDLKNNKIKLLPGEIGNYLYLNVLDLACNKIETVPDEISQLTAAQVINLYGNNIKVMPSLETLSYLQYLNVGSNELSELNFGPLESLEELVISSNPIKKLPDDIDELYPNLKILFANDMQLKEIPKSIGGLAMLEHLDLSHNKISEIPPSISEIESLKTFTISHNRLENSKERESTKNMSVGPWDCIEFWQSFTQLQEVDISFNKLKYLPRGIESFFGTECTVIMHGNPLVDKIPSNQIQYSIPQYGSRFKVGFAETLGRRPSMEDAVCIHGSLNDKADVDLFAVFDGHAGREAASWASIHLADLVIKKLPFKNPEKCFKEIFEELNENLKVHLSQLKDSSKKHCGTTAVVALIIGNKLYVANVGDSRAILDGGRRLTVDHKPRDEIERIRKHDGGHVSGNGGGRINGVLAVSRSIGDFYMQPWVSCIPHVTKVDLTKDDKYLILACDGIWDELSDEFSSSIVEELVMKGKLDLAATRLRDTAYAFGSDDNITVMIVKLNK